MPWFRRSGFKLKRLASHLGRSGQLLATAPTILRSASTSQGGQMGAGADGFSPPHLSHWHLAALEGSQGYPHGGACGWQGSAKSRN